MKCCASDCDVIIIIILVRQFKRGLRINSKLTHHSIDIMKFIYPIRGSFQSFIFELIDQKYQNTVMIVQAVSRMRYPFAHLHGFFQVPTQELGAYRVGVSVRLSSLYCIGQNFRTEGLRDLVLGSNERYWCVNWPLGSLYTPNAQPEVAQNAQSIF